MPGGKIAPDGRPAQAPGVGAQSKRHDLEMPGTPGLHNSDLQQGDVQMLEQGQRVAPRPKRTQPAAQGSSSRSAGQRKTVNKPQAGVPDPLEFAGARIGGKSVLSGGYESETQLDKAKWRPLLLSIAGDPTASGPLTAMITNYIAGMRSEPSNPVVDVFPQHDMETQIFRNM